MLSAARWWVAVSNPQKFEKIASNVQEQIVTVRQQCEDLLSWNVNDIRRQNEGKLTCSLAIYQIMSLLTMTIELKMEIVSKLYANDHLASRFDTQDPYLTAGLRENSDNRNLMLIQDLFGMSTWSLEQRHKELQEYKESVARETSDANIFEMMRLGNVTGYKTGPYFKEWETPGKSSMLLLIGSNYAGILELRRHCWISLLVSDLIDHFSTSTEFHAFYVFSLLRRTSLHTAVPEILFQLLRWKRRELGNGDYFALLSAGLSRYRAIDIRTDEEAKLEALYQLSATTLQLFKSEDTIYIILDRIDRCEDSERDDFLDTLINIMEEAVGYVKILAVANKTGWDVGERNVRERRSKGRRRTQFQQVVEYQNLLVSK